LYDDLQRIPHIIFPLLFVRWINSLACTRIRVLACVWPQGLPVYGYREISAGKMKLLLKNRQKKADPKVGFLKSFDYFAEAAIADAEPIIADAGADAIAEAGAAIEAADAAIEAADAAIEAAAPAAPAASPAIEAADAAIEAAASAFGISAGADIAGADIEAAIEAASSFLPQAAKATANREMINRDFFMGFP
jgi:hypothetical protein